jgi:hypothetical protein
MEGWKVFFARSYSITPDSQLDPVLLRLNQVGADLGAKFLRRRQMFTDKAVSKRGGNGKGKSPLWVRGLESSRTYDDDRALAVFHTDSLIPDQFHNTYKSKACLAPEKSLMLAVLHDAVVCFQDHVKARDKRKRRLFLEAEEWILSEDSRYLFSFENVCASLGFDAGYLRHGLLHWKAGTLATSKGKTSELKWPADYATT